VDGPVTGDARQALAQATPSSARRFDTPARELYHRTPLRR